MSSDLSSLVARLESVTTRLEGIASGGKIASGGEVSSEILDAFDSGVLGGKLKTYLDLSKKIGGEVKEHADVVEKAFKAERTVLQNAIIYKKPKPAVLLSVTTSLGNVVSKVQEFCDKRRGSKVFNHLMTVKEGIGCVGWVTVSPKPAPYIKETKDQALFYGNRVIKEFKGKNDTHVEWVRAYTGAIQELFEYVKTYHTTGLVWNAEGGELTGAGAVPSPGVAGPPPPPPPAIQPPTPATGSGDDTTAERANLFASINKGGDVTKGLRKVTDDMKTHKNPELRTSSVVKAQAKPAASKPAPKYGAPTATKKPPVLELQGKKWIVENQENQNNLTITNTNSKQAVYVYKCNKSTLKISGKVNSIVLDNCKRMALVFDGVISACEIVNSQSIQVQIVGQCPTVSIDKTDGCQVFLSKDSLKAVIVSAKSSEMNVCIPGKVDGDFSEHALPEQYRSAWNGKTFVTQCTDINC